MDKKWLKKWRNEKKESVEWWENHVAQVADELSRTIGNLKKQRVSLAEIDAQIAELEQAVLDG